MSVIISIINKLFLSTLKTINAANEKNINENVYNIPIVYIGIIVSIMTLQFILLCYVIIKIQRILKMTESGNLEKIINEVIFSIFKNFAERMFMAWCRASRYKHNNMRNSIPLLPRKKDSNKNKLIHLKKFLDSNKEKEKIHLKMVNEEVFIYKQDECHKIADINHINFDDLLNDGMFFICLLNYIGGEKLLCALREENFLVESTLPKHLVPIKNKFVYKYVIARYKIYLLFDIFMKEPRRHHKCLRQFGHSIICPVILKGFVFKFDLFSD